MLRNGDWHLNVRGHLLTRPNVAAPLSNNECPRDANEWSARPKRCHKRPLKAQSVSYWPHNPRHLESRKREFKDWLTIPVLPVPWPAYARTHGLVYAQAPPSTVASLHLVHNQHEVPDKGGGAGTKRSKQNTCTK